MTPAAKVVYLGALLLGLCLGASFGFQEVSPALRSLDESKRLTQPIELADFSTVQYRRADAEHAESALHMAANLLENMEKLSPEKGHKLELSVVYVRLALLQDAANNAPESHAYMIKARYWYKAYGGRDLEESEMKARLKAFDQSEQ